MRVRVGDRRFTGTAIDLRSRLTAAPPAEPVLAGIRSDDPVALPETDRSIVVDCAAPCPAHERVGSLPCDATLLSALAAAARSRGTRASVADELAARRRELADCSVPDVDLAGARERVAEATGAERRLRERVATLRGELTARRELDADTADPASELSAAAAALSEAETERLAAEQALDRANERAREARAARERRLELQDAVANLEREARRELARSVYPAFREALTAVPDGDPGSAGGKPAEYDGDPTAARLAAVRVAPLDAPVVVTAGATPEVGSASDWASVLDATVVRV